MPDEPDIPPVPSDPPPPPPHVPPVSPGNPPVSPGNPPGSPGNPPVSPGNPPVPPGAPPAEVPAGQPGTPPTRPVPEVRAAGCARRDHEGSARGFAFGGPLDQMEPGPDLDRHAGGAITDGLGTLDDDELIGLLCAARRLSSWTASIEVRAVSQLDARRRAYAATAGDLRQAQLRPHRPTLRRRSHHPLRPGRAHVRMQSLPRLQVITTHLAILVAR
jgi:hypothetical protein